MIIKVKNRKVATIPYLIRLVLKHIYEPEKFSLQEEYIMQHSIVSYANKAIKHEDEQEVIEKLAWMIKKNEEGFYQRDKLLMREHGIDYKKVYLLPESRYISKERRAELEVIKKAQRPN